MEKAKPQDNIPVTMEMTSSDCIISLLSQGDVSPLLSFSFSVYFVFRFTALSPPHLHIQYWTPNFHNCRTIGAELNIEGWRKLRTGIARNSASMVGPCESLSSALIK